MRKRYVGTGASSIASYSVRDVTLGEDRSRIRHNPGSFARMRSFALNILRSSGVTNIAEALYDNALSFDRILSYVGSIQEN